MRALCWNGVNDLSVETVADPGLLNPHDAIIRVRLTTTCGSGLHVIDGLSPSMREGDILGHEFMGEVVEVGSAVKNIRRGDRVVVPSFISCGSCWYCQHQLPSCCDNTNPQWEKGETVLGHPTGGIYAYSHAFGGYAGSHAEYVRVPFADNDCFVVPEGVSDEQALFLSDAAPTGYMGADFCNIHPGDTVGRWGCGGVGLMAQQSAWLMGAHQVIGAARTAVSTLSAWRRAAKGSARFMIKPNSCCIWKPTSAPRCVRRFTLAAKAAISRFWGYTA